MKDVKDILLADLPASQVNKISQGIDITTKNSLNKERQPNLLLNLYTILYVEYITITDTFPQI